MTPFQVGKNFVVQKCDILGLQMDFTCFLAHVVIDMMFL